MDHNEQVWKPLGLWLLVGAALVVLAIHAAGRTATLCGNTRVDSLIYGVSALRFWSAGATANDLVPDKPPGQALLTGWVFHVWPGPPSRLTLVPVESLFLLTAYAAFWLPSARIVGTRIGTIATILFVLGHNAFNVLDSTTDGLNLNENYLAVFLVGGAAAHILVHGNWRRGLLCGLCIGTALTIKQTAAALLLAVVLHESWMAVRGRSLRSFTVACAGGLVGIVLSWTPMVAVLLVRGWLGPQLHDLMTLSGAHVAGLREPRPTLVMFRILLPMLWCLAAAGVTFLCSRRTRAPTTHRMRLSLTGIAAFAALWLVMECLIISQLSIPAMHYWQQVIAPLCLGVAVGLRWASTALKGMSAGIRFAVTRWFLATLCILALYAALPVFGLAAVRVWSFDSTREVQDFADWLAHWSPRSIAQQWRHLP